MSALTTGLSALRVSQQLLQLTGQNIANANTPGYHRQIAELTEKISGGPIGSGVDLQRISRSFNQLLEDSALRNTSNSSSTSTLVDGLSQIQSSLAPGDGSINDLLGQFFDDAEKLSANPSDLSQRRAVVATADTLANQIGVTNENFRSLGDSFVTRAQDVVTQINSLTTSVARLNQQIRDATAIGGAVNDLQDRRANVLDQLSQLADIRTVPNDLNQVNVFIGGWGVVMGETTSPLTAKVDSTEKLVVATANSQAPVAVAGGQLAGLQTLANSTLPAVRGQFDQFTKAFVAQINGVQATGLGLGGPQTFVAGSQVVDSASDVLSTVNLPMPPKAGDLYVTVTNLATGKRTLNKVSIDPTTQSLHDVAAAISTIPHLQGTTGAGDTNLTIMAGAGYAFDFTGNCSTAPDVQAITGSTVPTISGSYTGSKNETLTFKFLGSGTIGASPNLVLQARDGSGNLVASLNVGAGYEAGTDLPDVLGVKIKLTTGTVNSGDSFALNVAANPDTGGLLPALGLQSFFVGNGTTDIRVNQDLLDHPELLALSKTGAAGDGSNLARIVAMRDQRVLNGGTQSLGDFFQGLLGDVGSQTSDASARSTAYQALGQSLDQQIQSASGVDTNEEMIKLVQYQRSFQFSAQYINIVNQTLDDLLKLL